jgi:hypothetical protein
MIVAVTYNKNTGEIYVSSDLSDAPAVVNTNSVVDNNTSVNFEIAINTTVYEHINELPSE